MSTPYRDWEQDGFAMHPPHKPSSAHISRPENRLSSPDYCHLSLEEPELTANFLTRLEKKIQPYLDITEITNLILQLDKVRYIDCISLGRLLFLQKTFEKRGKTLYLSGLSHNTQEILEKTGLIHAFNLI